MQCVKRHDEDEGKKGRKQWKKKGEKEVKK